MLHIRSLTELSHLLVQRFILLAQQNIRHHGSFHVALSGGKTPQLFYQLLATSQDAQQIPWQQIHIYLTDERFVPHTHIDSNMGMIKNILLDHVPIPAAHIHAMLTQHVSPDQAAALYEYQLKQYLPQSPQGHLPLDFILLGLGEDGHVASLFPNTDILQITDKLSAAVFVDALQSWRISLTFPMLRAAREVAILVASPSKAPVLQHVFSEASVEKRYPLQELNLTTIEWYIEVSRPAKLA